MEENKNHSDNPQAQQSSPREGRSFFTKLKGNKLALVVVILAVVVLVGGIFALTKGILKRQGQKQESKSNSSTASAGNNNDMFMRQYGQGCKDRDVSFTSAPMKPEELSYIRPLGAVSDGHVTPTDHVYVGGPNSNAADIRMPYLCQPTAPWRRLVLCRPSTSATAPTKR